MKKLLIVLSLFLSLLIFAQGFTVENNNLSFSEIVEVSTKTKAEIYKGIKLFLNETNEKSKYFIDLDDPESGIVSYSAQTPYYELSYMYLFKASYKATIDIKDGKFRYTIAKVDFFKNMIRLNLDLKSDYQSILEESDSQEELDRLNKELTETKRDKKKAEIVDTIEKTHRNIEEVKGNIEKTKKIISDQPLLIKEYILKNDW